MTKEAPIHAFAVSAALTALEVDDEPLVADAAPPAVDDDPDPAPTVPLVLGDAVTLRVVPLLAAVAVLITIDVPFPPAIVPFAAIKLEYADALADTYALEALAAADEIFAAAALVADAHALE